MRYDGTEILVDPGTYCYHGEPEWRSYFRSTLAHNTIEIDGTDQSTEGGPFMWTTHADARVTRADLDDRRCQVWSAEVDGYARLGTGVRHARTVMLDSGSRHVLLIDVVTAETPRQLRMAFHLGPEVTADVTGTVGRLTWQAGADRASADLLLPWQLSWTLHRAETDPPLGWYSPRFGERVPTTTVLGTGTADRRLELRTLVVFPSA